MTRMGVILLFLVVVILHTHAFKPRSLIGKGSVIAWRRPLDQRSFSTLKNQIQDIDMLDPTNLATSLHLPSFLTNEEVIGFSNLSFYFTLFLYIVSLPGLFSLVTRSVKPSPTQRTYDIPGPANPTAKPVRQLAAEILAYFKALNYDSTASQDLITFRGVLGKSRAQAAFLTFCTFLGLASFGLVLSVLLPDLGTKAYLVTLLSPYAGIYYWNNAQRIDEVKVKIEISDDEQITTVIAQGDKEDLERFSKSLSLPERGKIYVKGIFENDDKKEAIMNNYIVLDKKPQSQMTKQAQTSSNIEASPPPTQTAISTAATPPTLEGNNGKSQ